MLSDQPYRYLTVDEMKSLGDDSLPIDVTRDERMDSNKEATAAPLTAVDETASPQHIKDTYAQYAANYTPDNVELARHPVHVGAEVPMELRPPQKLVTSRAANFPNGSAIYHGLLQD
ncbi:Ankyrin-3 [Gryllus bimaculatus]|nr:Ankyrin-3 [Gryllus bimaculatus]